MKDGDGKGKAVRGGKWDCTMERGERGEGYDANYGARRSVVL